MNKIDQFRRRGMSYESRGLDLNSMSAGYTESTCHIKVNNTGETVAPFYFSCKYAQLPTINFGFQAQSDPIPGRTPLFNCMVVDWFVERALPNSELYTGAQIMIISENREGVSFVVNATASGIAFSGPTNELR